MSPDQAIADEIRRLEEQYARYPEGYAFARLADAYRKARDAARALAILEQGLRKHPRYLSAHIVRARSLRDLGRLDEAVEAFRAVLELDPQNLVALRTLAEIARERGELEQAVRWYRGLAELEPLDEGVREALEELRAGVRTSGPGDSVAGAADLPGSPPDGAGAGDARAAGEPEAGGEVGPASAGEPAGGESSTEGRELAGGQQPPGGQEPGESASRAGEKGEEGEEPEGGGEGDLVVTATMGDLYMRQELYEEAVKVYERLLRARPGDPGLLEKLDAARRLSAGRGARAAAGSAQAGGVQTRGLPRKAEAGRTIRDYLTQLVEGDARLPEGEEGRGGSRFARWLGRDDDQED